MEGSKRREITEGIKNEVTNKAGYLNKMRYVNS
jgi:hypothetical protein